MIDYLEIRLGLYKKRKAWLLKEFANEIAWLEAKARFITGVINGTSSGHERPVGPDPESTHGG